MVLMAAFSYGALFSGGNSILLIFYITCLFTISGASPNYKDLKGLTPLYYCVSNSSDVVCCELLLHDRASVGATDLQGWQEVHQACRNGLVAHLEQLLYYGAELNARNASGNTPLHVCAVNNQESCARTLLFRGSDKNALNFAGQTPYQVSYQFFESLLV